MDDMEEKTSIQFELPEIGLRALKDLESSKKKEKDEKKDGEEEKKSGEPVLSVQDMASILNRQATKTHERPPMQSLQQNPATVSSDAPPGQSPSSGGKMIIGLTGAYAGGRISITQEAKQEGEKESGYPEDLEEFIDFLDESIVEYEKYVNNIGKNGLAAVNVGYYRDDIQDMLDLLKYDERINLRPFWERIVKIDLQLRAKAPLYVREVGFENFKQYQIINDPPAIRWWWYLNRIVAPPVTKPKFWEIWK